MRFRFSIFGLLFCLFLSTAFAQVQFFPPLQQTIFVIEGSPEGRVAMDVGVLLVDRVSGKLWQKRTPHDVATGWVDVAAGGGGGSVPSGTGFVHVTSGVQDAAASTAVLTTSSNATTTVAGIIRLAGDLSGTATTPTLKSTGTAGTYYRTTFDAQGRETSGVATFSESDLTTTDVTTGDVSITKHGFAPKLPNDVTKFLNGVGTYTVPAGGGGGSATNLTPWTTDIDGNQKRLTNAVLTGTESWYNVVDYGADKTGASDSTTAIQAAMNAAAGTTNSATATTVYFPNGVYLVGGAAGGSQGENSQLLIPAKFHNSNFTNWSTIRFLGDEPFAYWDGSSTSGQRSRQGSVILSTLTTSGANVIGTVGQTNSTWNDVTAIFEKLNFQVRGDFAGTVLNLSNILNARITMCSVAQTNGSTSVSQPVTGTVGIDMPRFNLDFIWLDDVNVVGFDYGIKVGEHTIAGMLSLNSCIHGLTFKNSQHANTFDHIYSTGCNYPVYVEAASHFDIRSLNVERMGTGDWKTNIYDVYDPSNLGHGNVNWIAKDLISSANDHKVKVNGGQNIKFVEMQTDAFGSLSTSAGTVTPKYLLGPHHFYVDNSARNAGFTSLKARGTSGTPTVITSGDITGMYAFGGYDGANYQESAAIYGTSEGTVSSGNVPIGIAFYTGTNLSTQARRALIDANGNFKIAGVLTATNPVLTTPNLGVAAATSVTVNDDAYGSGWDGSTNVPTKNAIYDKIETVVAGGGGITDTSTNTFSNKTYDASATGNVLKFKSYLKGLSLRRVDGVGCTIPNTNDFTATPSTFMVPRFSGTAATNANYCRFGTRVPKDWDTSVTPLASITIRLTGSDTAAQTYNVGFASVADGSVSAATVGNWIALTVAANGSGSADKVQSVSNVSLTGWTPTPGQWLVVEFNRDGATDASTLATDLLELELEYGATQ